MHHANVLIGEKEWAYSLIPLEAQCVNPDVIHATYERMSVDDVRALIAEVMVRPVYAKIRIFVISAHSILDVAQNALLKIFEEPNEHTIFYLIIPREDMLLPTLRSRLHCLGVEAQNIDTKIFKTFLERSYTERIALIAEKIKEEDTVWVLNIIRGAEQYAEAQGRADLMHDVLMVSTYAQSSGSSKKMLLDHLALAL